MVTVSLWVLSAMVKVISEVVGFLGLPMSKIASAVLVVSPVGVICAEYCLPLKFSFMSMGSVAAVAGKLKIIFREPLLPSLYRKGSTVSFISGSARQRVAKRVMKESGIIVLFFFISKHLN